MEASTSGAVFFVEVNTTLGAKTEIIAVRDKHEFDIVDVPYILNPEQGRILNDEMLGLHLVKRDLGGRLGGGVVLISHRLRFAFLNSRAVFL
ncbi:rhodanese-like domain-containing protein [Devriesea agamarum]|uniref:hypothetical protein n=1 Tax=Devriesea agamarum TaxID=472569 RepID=UPI00071C9D99|nr:hypothetical protein [Devriesea agamarum]